MHALTALEIDNELASRGREIDAVTATLLELDRHPGLVLLRGIPPTGVTARQWAPIEQLLDLMWEDFGRVQAILDQARVVRAQRTKLTEADRTELTRLLRERPHEAARTAIPMAQRSLTGPGEQVLFVGIADTLERMRTAFPQIARFLDAVDAANSRVLEVLKPVQSELSKLGGVTPELRAIADAVADMLGRSATDPLATTAAEIDTRTAELARRLERESRDLVELRVLTADWPAAITQTRDRLAAVGAVVDRAALAREQVQEKIHTAPLPAHRDETGPLRGELDTLADGVVDARAAFALRELRRRIAAAQTRAEQALELAQGLLDRRAELRGRLAAYQVKAARLGVSEESDVLSANRIATGLLGRVPCDLAAVTRAITDYQQVVADVSGRRG
ncbi:hypothetical protein [Nocardia macrotermitis]|uniref:Uncharacterized protein n=1 Tax=Nocardia macrotermitis TaxID=2585198 RepID=A0A7K0D0N0_9NOCA|nr:hypothetical protein [Nocardia macrotermitis]MQY19248.1 hypothetical protein [Nocardia macrotermitis]